MVSGDEVAGAGVAEAGVGMTVYKSSILFSKSILVKKKKASSIYSMLEFEMITDTLYCVTLC